MKLTLLPSRRASAQTTLIGSSGKFLAALSLTSVAVFGSIHNADANVITNGTFDAGLTDWTATSEGPNASWTSVDYGAESIGRVAQFQSANPVDLAGSLRQSFLAISSPIMLTYNANWLFGPVNDGSLSSGLMLLNSDGDGYAFYNRHNNAGFGFIWQAVDNGIGVGENLININTSQLTASNGGGMGSFSLIGDGAGNWNFSGSVLVAPGVPATFTTGSFSTGTTVSSFSQIWLLGQGGANNSQTPLYDNVSLDAVPEPSTLLLGAVGFAGVLMARRRFRKASH